MALDIAKLVSRFVGESRDRLAELRSGLAALETDPDDTEVLAGVFRHAHTIKGSARMLKLAGIGESAHRLEDVLAALRDRRIRFDPVLGGLLLRAVDAMGSQLDRTESSGGDAPPDLSLCDALARAASGSTSTGDASEGPRSPAPSPARDTDPETTAPRPSPEPHFRTPDSVRVRLSQLDGLVQLAGEALGAQARLADRLGEARALERALLAAGPPSEAGGHGGSFAGEIRRFVQRLREDLHAQERLAVDLKDQALAMRMMPLETVFEPSARMARELARSQGKELRCDVRGGEIELDRQIVERLGDALLHLVRNAVDHGIQMPAERRASGKPEVGHLWLSARHAGGQAIVEIRDDGRGLDRQSIVERALRSGLIDPAQADALTDDRAAELIFAPGLSTSPIVTELSGRGVGMDAVKRTVVDELHGSIAVFGQLGQGCGFSLELPLSLASMRVVLLECNGHCLGLAASHVFGLVRVGPEDTIDLAGRPALVLGNEFLPLISLADLIGLPMDAREAPRARGLGERHRRWAAVIEVRRSKLALTVDRVLDEREMVVRTVPSHLRACNLVAGILTVGDRRLAPLLHHRALSDAARGEVPLRTPAPTQVTADPPHILVVDDSPNTRELVSAMLEAYGYRTTTAADGLAGWQKALGGRFQAVLTDVEMPGLDGFALTARLRADERYRTTPIVILTSRAREQDKRRGIEVGADAYLVKGDFEQSSLLDTLKSLLG